MCTIFAMNTIVFLSYTPIVKKHILTHLVVIKPIYRNALSFNYKTLVVLKNRLIAKNNNNNNNTV